MTTTPLTRAIFFDDAASALHRLPDDVVDLLLDLNAPPRLAIHLRLVHDVAVRLTAEVERRWPRLAVDASAVRFGAAIHDIGKVLHPAELTGPGSAHERAGYDLLIARGVAEPLARFARTHASWTGPGIRTEDLLVGLADKVWKGRRQDDLEQRFLGELADAARLEAWEVFLELDDVLGRLADDGPARLAHQACHPVG